MCLLLDLWHPKFTRQPRSLDIQAESVHGGTEDNIKTDQLINLLVWRKVETHHKILTAASIFYNCHENLRSSCFLSKMWPGQ